MKPTDTPTEPGWYYFEDDYGKGAVQFELQYDSVSGLDVLRVIEGQDEGLKPEDFGDSAVFLKFDFPKLRR